MRRDIWVRLYEHDACGLCHEVLRRLQAVAPRWGLRVERVDIRRHPRLWREFALDVPVVELDGVIRLRPPFDMADIESAVRRLRRLYHRQQAIYDRNWARLGACEQRWSEKGRMARWRTRFAQEVLRAVPATAPLRVLELAVGPGLNEAWYPSPWRVVVSDWTGHYFRQKKPARAHAVVCDAHLLPWVDGAFDLVVSTFSLCAFFSIPRVAHEVHRVLKPGGSWWTLDHVAGPGPLRWLQAAIKPLWFRLAGCFPDRPVAALLERTGLFRWTFWPLWDHLVIMGRGHKPTAADPTGTPGSARTPPRR